MMLASKPELACMHVTLTCVTHPPETMILMGLHMSLYQVPIGSVSVAKHYNRTPKSWAYLLCMGMALAHGNFLPGGTT